MNTESYLTKFTGKLTFSMSTKRGRTSLELLDKTSGVLVFKLLVSPHQLGELLATGSCEDVSAELLHTAIPYIGCTPETKEIHIDRPEHLQSTGAGFVRARELLAPYEIDGWQGTVGDLFNVCKRNQNGRTYRVTFARMVKPDGTPVLRSASDEGDPDA